VSSCGPDRPCGAEGSRLSKIIPQGWRGADFKSTCRAHDQCYGTLGVAQSSCDAQFKQNLLASCEYSNRPAQCRRVARLMSRAVTKHGEKAFNNGQREAAGILK